MQKSFPGPVDPKYQSTTEVWAQGTGVIILFNTQAAELTWDWLEITMDGTKGSNWLLKSGMMCVCDHKRLIVTDLIWTGVVCGASSVI